MPELLRSEAMRVQSATDLVLARQRVRALSGEQGFSLVDQTKIVTAASELARNMLDYGQGGEVRFELLREGLKKGLRITFEDQGPGIPDIEQALRDGFTTGGGMGLGLGGAKRLVNEFSIESKPGQGTRVVITRWK